MVQREVYLYWVTARRTQEIRKVCFLGLHKKQGGANMVLILPLVFITFYLLILQRVKEIPRATAITTIAWYSVMLLFTEVLSVIHKMTKGIVFIVWLIVFLISLYICYKKRAFTIKSSLIPTTKLGKCLAVFGLLWILLLGFAAIGTVPYNYDSMTYHLSRVANWVQNASVNHYATNIERQLFSPVLAEYAVLHTYLLSGGDQFVNLIQFGAYLISAILIYGIAKTIHLNKVFCYVAVVLFLTMPMAVAQSVTTQVDMVGTMWLLIFVYLLIGLVREERLTCSKETVFEIILIASCCGFGFLSKSTVCVSMLVFLAWFAIVRFFKKDSIFVLIRLAGLAALVVAIIVCETFIRNALTVGGVFASDNFSSILVSTYDPRLLILNLFKNISIQVNSNLLFFLGQGLTMAGNAMASLMGVDINDFSIAFNGIDYSLISGEMLYHHDEASNPMIVILAFIGLILFIVLIVQKKIDVFQRNFCIITILSFILIASVIKWSPYQTRLMLPATAVLCVYTACILEHFCKKEIIAYCAASAVTAMVFFEGVDTLVVNVGIPILYQPTHMDGFFCGTKTKYAEGYKEICNYVKEKNFDEVGLLLGLDSYEYPLWYALPGVTIHHVIFNEESYLQKYVDINETPDCIIAIEAGAYPVGSTLTYHGTVYESIYEYEDCTNYVILEKIS